MEKSTQQVLNEMRQMSNERLALLRRIVPNTCIDRGQYEAIENVIDDVRVLWKIIDWLNEQLTSLSREVAPAHALHSLFVKHPDVSPETIWNAFVKSETEYLSKQEPQQPIDLWH